MIACIPQTTSFWLSHYAYLNPAAGLIYTCTYTGIDQVLVELEIVWPGGLISRAEESINL